VSTFLKTGVLSLTLHTSVRGKDRDTYAPVLTRAVQSLTLGGAGGDDAIRAKLKALESARQAGILSDAEYQAKKAELEATLKPPAPKIDGPTREKLAALDAALAAGILTKAEYEQKKAALLGGAAPTPTRPVIPAPPPTVPVIPAPPPTAPAMKPYADPQQRFTVQFPAGWTAQAFPNNQGVAFMHGQRAVSVLLVGGAGTTQQIVTGIAANLAGQWKGYRQTARPPRTVCGQASPAVSFSGTNPQGLVADG